MALGILKRTGYSEVTTVVDGQQAMDELHRRGGADAFDIILTDLHMPHKVCAHKYARGGAGGAGSRGMSNHQWLMHLTPYSVCPCTIPLQYVCNICVILLLIVCDPASSSAGFVTFAV